MFFEKILNLDLSDGKQRDDLKKKSQLLKKLTSPKETIGVAFGSGGARGWAHVGVLLALKDLGIKAEVVTGASVGAIVAGVYATNSLENVFEFARNLDLVDSLGMFIEIRLPKGGGFIEGTKVINVLSKFVPDVNIETLRVRYGAVATDLYSGEPIEITSGSLMDAVRSSISIPGIFTPVWSNDRYLIDGGLSNPIPVDLAYKLGATKVIGVNINAVPPETQDKSNKRKTKNNPPNLFDVMVHISKMVEGVISEKTMNNFVFDCKIEPYVHTVGTLEFFKINESVKEGYEATLRAFGLDKAEFKANIEEIDLLLKKQRK